jgi:hypothetical protein
MTTGAGRDLSAAAELMLRFTERTGLAADGAQRRYLWTDAFAVANLLGLARTTGEDRYARLALQLVDCVHRVLGCHRADDTRAGWLSGAGDAEGAAHPTRGGLRIGKPLPERPPTAPIDETLEWDRDGQYFHYLTKWMHALDLVTRATHDPVFNLWARELAERAYAAFTYAAPGSGQRRMYWKMSIDLGRPLVASMGQHDPLDGYVTCVQLQTTASWLAGAASGPHVGDHATAFAAMLAGADLRTGDPLGIGGLLCDACRVEQLVRQGASWHGRLLEDLLAAALAGLRYWLQQREIEAPAAGRLAFRELGLAIGLRAVDAMRRACAAGGGDVTGEGARAQLTALARYAPLANEMVAFWAESVRHEAPTWSDHRDINEVMLATALVPEGFLFLAPLR